MATIHVILSNSGGELDRRTITYRHGDDIQDAGAAAREAAIDIIRDCGHLRVGDCIRVVEG